MIPNINWFHTNRRPNLASTAPELIILEWLCAHCLPPLPARIIAIRATMGAAIRVTAVCISTGAAETVCGGGDGSRPMSALGHSRPGPAGRRTSHVPYAPKATVGHLNAIGRDGPTADIPPFHSITSSARTRTDGGISNLSALAALLLTISSSWWGTPPGDRLV
jgi:hypothetical protein